MANIIKIQHYVPQFYLRNFAVKSKTNFLLNCFDKPTGKSFLTDIRKIGAEKHFYDADDQQLEKTLAKLESKFNITYKNLLKSADINSLTADDKISLGYFIVTQWLRTKEKREMIKDMIKQLIEHLSKEKLSPVLEAQLREANTERSIKSLHLDLLKEDLPRYVDIILGMKWMLFINKTDITYWTSDHPVCMFNSLDLWPYGNLGLLSRGIEIHFPLSPTLKLCICDPIRFNKLPANFNVTDKQNIIFANSLQVNWSTRHIFSITDDFSLAEKMVRENPTLRNLDRKRVSVN